MPSRLVCRFKEAAHLLWASYSLLDGAEPTFPERVRSWGKVMRDKSHHLQKEGRETGAGGFEHREDFSHQIVSQGSEGRVDESVEEADQP